jgi:hypothetical protein
MTGKGEQRLQDFAEKIQRASTWKNKERGQIIGRWIVGIGGGGCWLGTVFNSRSVCGVEPSGFAMTVLATI